jgi:hypothetical protein
MSAIEAPSGRTGTTVPRPSALRRAAVVVTGVAAAALPVAWGLSSVVQIVTGSERDHLFHQLTGQGVLLCALWLGALVPLVLAGWRGRRPGAAAALGHISVAVGTVLAAALAPGNGGLLVGAIVLVTGALLWLALPARPRVAVDGLDPVLTPLALGLAALLVPYVLVQATLQRAMADEHARMSHYFDMAWLGTLLIALAVSAALVPAARRLAAVAAAGTLVVGACRVLLTTDLTWSLAAVGLGVAGVVAAVLRDRRPVRAN